MSVLDEIVKNIRNKNFVDALKLCENNIDDRNQHVIYNFKGIIFLSQNNFEQAEKYFLNSLKFNSVFVDPLKNLFILNDKKKNLKKIIEYAKKLYQINKLDPLFNFLLGYALQQSGKLEESIEFYENSIKYNGKEKLKALNNIGIIYSKLNKVKKSNKYFLEANKISQNDKYVINNLLSNYIKLRDKKNTSFFFEKAKNLDQNFNVFLYNKAEYYLQNNQIENAIDILQKNKNQLKFLIRLIKINLIIGKKDIAKELITELEKIKTNDPEYFQFLGMRYLFQGKFDIGWKYYEYRFEKSKNILNNIDEWKGENLNKKSIVIYSEQGLGDAIQFSKFIIPLLKLSNNVVFLVQKKILKNFKIDIPNLKISSLETFDNNSNFDFKISLGSLIKFFYKEKIDENLLINKNNLLDLPIVIKKDKLNVGIAWSGSFNGPNEPYRSIPLEALNKIFSLDINFYCLQNEIWERDLFQFKKKKITDLGNYSLSEMVAIIQNLDLVISSDTSILHLAASLNKETWGLLNLHPDWRWGAFNDMHPYNSLKLFQQKAFDKWDDVEQEIYENLKKKLKNT
tara:strand:- start:196 stop:1899 length:1704 start_codon:yes stop_codon:yes gene_type:complete